MNKIRQAVNKLPAQLRREVLAMLLYDEDARQSGNILGWEDQGQISRDTFRALIPSAKN